MIERLIKALKEKWTRYFLTSTFKKNIKIFFLFFFRKSMGDTYSTSRVHRKLYPNKLETDRQFKKEEKKVI